MREPSFFVKPADVDRVVNSATKAILHERSLLAKKMRAIAEVVYATAHAKRPKISRNEQKALGRNPKSYRVSDPKAEYGVPVDTGVLQASIKKEVKDSGKKITIEVFVDPASEAAKYATFMEFGTSKIAARPFMRPALLLNREWIRRRFTQKD